LQENSKHSCSFCSQSLLAFLNSVTTRY
jgi:hypothetical protein